MSHVVIRSFGTVAGDSLSNCSAGAAPSLRSQRLDSRPLWCSRLAASDPRITVVAPACSRSASALTSRLTIRPSRRRFAARLNSGVRRGKKHSGSVASTSDAIAPGTSRRFCSGIPSGSVRRAACRTLSSAASALSPVICFPTVPLVRRLRFGHNDLVHRPLWCSRLAAGDPRITVVAPACSRSASALTSRLTIRPSRRRFVAALRWQRKPATACPPLRSAA